jgi:prepilin-type N-terminal cleavage/methylation domain-containing protein
MMLKHKRFKKLQTSKGFTLLETVVAILILGSSMALMLSIVGDGVNQARFGYEKQTANYLAQEGIELIRNHRANHQLLAKNSNTLFSVNNGNWSSDIASCSIKCTVALTQNNSTLYIASCSSVCQPLIRTERYGYTLNQSGTGSSDTVSPFIRTIEIKQTGNIDVVEVVSTITWKNSVGIENKIQYKTFLTSWNE